MPASPRQKSWLAPAARRQARATRVSVEAMEQRQLQTGGIPTPAHVVLVVEENHASSQILGNASAPYINSLAKGSNTALLTNSYGVAHPSQPNYIALFSGSTQGVAHDTVPKNVPFKTPNLGSELLASGHTFVGYAETLLNTGYTGEFAGYYNRKHNPWVNWQDSPINGVPAADNQPFRNFPTDYANLPTVSYVVPNVHNDMEDGTVPQADAWLKKNFANYIEWAQSNNSLFILTFDEDDKSHGNHIITLFIGPMVKGGVSAQKINHLNVLRTIEDMYNLPYAGATAKAKALTGIWVDNGSINPVAPAATTTKTTTTAHARK
jgi:phosphatidylinositol-3-phosphatase